KGIEEFEKKIKDLQENAKKISGQNQVPWSELFNDKFMLEYTSYKSIHDFIQASGYHIEKNEDLNNIPDKDWDGFIKKSTSFSSWEEMLSTAGTMWAKEKLGI
ncbi:TPA: hypothetical protein JBH83_15520, partial [Legionella pneumophila]|nr:hypothetical protein [Legionella pneumophila]